MASPSREAWCISFFGMHPTLTHVPPKPHVVPENDQDCEINFFFDWQSCHNLTYKLFAKYLWICCVCFISEFRTCICKQTVHMYMYPKAIFFYLPWVDGVTKSKTATFFWSWEAIKKFNFTFNYQFFSSWQHSQFNISNTMTNSWFFIIFLEREVKLVLHVCACCLCCIS